MLGKKYNICWLRYKKKKNQCILLSIFTIFPRPQDAVRCDRWYAHKLQPTSFATIRTPDDLANIARTAVIRFVRRFLLTISCPWRDFIIIQSPRQPNSVYIQIPRNMLWKIWNLCYTRQMYSWFGCYYWYCKNN